MNTNPLETLEPQNVWHYFYQLNQIPRASKKESQVIDFMYHFGKELGLETHKDTIGNIIIKKPASKGYENHPTIILQSHLDMVHQKNNDCVFDFDTQAINMLIEGDWVHANGTTLGADNGIGVAYTMAILASSNISHPALEALFTIDEETGMTGAKNLEAQYLNGKILLNLDTEEDDEINVGCAGGIDTTIQGTYVEKNSNPNYKALQINLTGLKGGHSGTDIHLGLGNANLLLIRALYELNQLYDYEWHHFTGGGLRNAIPREAETIISFEQTQLTNILDELKKITQRINTEYSSIEPQINWLIETIDLPQMALEKTTQKNIIHAILATFNGVYSMSPDIEGLVETSSNLAKIILKNGQFNMHSLQRSSVETAKIAVAQKVAAPYHLLAYKVEHSGSYPGWKPAMQAKLLQYAITVYENLFEKKPKIIACHAGLECGLLKKHLPDTQMISFGPNIHGAHSPSEKVQISSVQKSWKFLLNLLQKGDSLL